MRGTSILAILALACLMFWWASERSPILEVCAGSDGGVHLRKADGKVEIEIDGKPFTAYHYSSDLPKPFLHPLRSASGKIVTRLYPMEKVEGEPQDHPHHRGCWFAHGDVNGVDFWAEGSGANKGKIVHRDLVRIESGREKGRLTARLDWVGPDGKPVLEEERDIRIYSRPDARVLDFNITLHSKYGPVTFGDTKEGTFAIRVAAPLDEKHSGRIVNSDGLTTEKQAWGKRARWVDYRGTLDGESIGIAIFDHPKSFRHPTYWHVRGYGLFAANPFGERDFTGDKRRDGSYKLDANSKISFHYRVFIHSCDKADARIEDEYKAYASLK